MKTKGSLYANFNYLQIKKKVYNNSFNGSFLITHAILKNVVSRKRAIKFSDLPVARSAQATARNSTNKTIPK